MFENRVRENCVEFLIGEGKLINASHTKFNVQTFAMPYRSRLVKLRILDIDSDHLPRSGRFR